MARLRIAQAAVFCFVSLYCLAIIGFFLPHRPSSGTTTAPQTKDLVIAIGSAFRHAARRQEARETWLRWTTDRVLYKFFTEIDLSNREEVLAFEEEQRLHGDLVLMEGLPSGYAHFAERALFQMSWATHRASFGHYLRIDDDTFLCLHRLLFELPYRPRSRLMWVKYWCWESFACPDENFMLFSADVVQFFVSSTERGLLQIARQSTFAVNSAFWVHFLNLSIFDDRLRIDAQQGYLTSFMHSQPQSPYESLQYSRFCTEFIYAHHVAARLPAVVFAHTLPLANYSIPPLTSPSEACGRSLSFTSVKHHSSRATAPSPPLTNCTCTYSYSLPVSFEPIQSHIQNLSSGCHLDFAKVNESEIAHEANCFLRAHQLLGMHDKRHRSYAYVFEWLAKRFPNAPVPISLALLISSADINERWQNPRVDLLELALKLDPSSPLAWSVLGRSYLRLGNVTGAFSAFAKANDLAPSDGANLYQEGVLLKEMNTYASRALLKCVFAAATRHLDEPFRSAALLESNPTYASDWKVLSELDHRMLSNPLVDLEKERLKIVARLREPLHAVFTKEILKESTRVFLLDFPDHANAGDSAIWLGEVEFLKRAQHRVAHFSCRCRACNLTSLQQVVRSSDALLLHGGGNFGDLFSACNNDLRHKIVRQFPNNTIVVFPQTMVPWTDSTAWKVSSHIYCKYPRRFLFARDAVTYAAMQRVYACANVVVSLVPDMAFWMETPPFVANYSASKHDIVWLGRTDKEKRGLDPQNATDALVVDWFGPDAQHPDPLSGFFEQALYATKRAVRMLSQGRVVVTDRLHAHIISVIMGIPHVVMDNSFGKIRTFYQQWTKSVPYAFAAATPGEALSMARQLVKLLSRDRHLQLTPELLETKNFWLSVPGGQNAFPQDPVDVSSYQLHQRALSCLPQEKADLTHSRMSPLPTCLATSRFHQSLFPFVRKLQDPQHRIILSFVTGAYVHIALNWAESLRRCSVSNFVLVALDKMAYHALESKLKEHLFFFAPLADLEPSTSSSFDFETPEFLSLMRMRAWVLCVLLHGDVSILFSDLDVVFLQDPFAPLNGLLYNELLLSSNDWRHVNITPNYNGGFFFAKNTTTLKLLFSGIYLEMLQSSSLDDQTALILAVKRSKSLQVALLPDKQYMNGYLYWERQLRSPNLVMVHANWIYSMPNKVFRLREAGMWYVEEENPSQQQGYVTSLISHTSILQTARILQVLVDLALRTNRTLVLPRIPRSSAESVPLWDTFERYFDVGRLEQVLREHQFIGWRWMYSPALHTALADAAWLGSSSTCVEHWKAEFSSAPPQGSGKLLVVCDPDASWADKQPVSEYAVTAVWYTKGLSLRVAKITSVLRSRALLNKTSCVRLSSVDQLHAWKTVIDSLLASSVLRISVPLALRSTLSFQYTGLLLSSPYVQDDDEMLVLLEVEYCISSDVFLYDSPSLFVDVVNAHRPTQTPPK